MDMEKFRRLMKEDDVCKDIDLDAFEKEYNDFIGEHGDALNELAEQTHIIEAERVRAVRLCDPEELRRDILAQELRTTGIDWARFHAGNQNEKKTVDEYLGNFNLPFNADDILDGSALTKLTASGGNHPESVTVAESQTISQYTGDNIKNFVFNKAHMYQQIKNAAASNDRLHFITGMLMGGALAFGGTGARAAGHARNSGANIPHAIVAGITALGGFEIGFAVATALFLLVFIFSLIFDHSSLTAAFMNRTPSGLAINGYHNAHGHTPVYTHGLTAEFGNTNTVVALPELDLGDLGSQVFLGYWYQQGNTGFNGAGTAIQFQLLSPLGGGPNGLGSNNMYSGYWIKKFGASYQLTGINSDRSPAAFWNRHFNNSDVSSSNGTITISARMNSYAYEITAKERFQLVVVQHS